MRLACLVVLAACELPPPETPADSSRLCAADPGLMLARRGTSAMLESRETRLFIDGHATDIDPRDATPYSLPDGRVLIDDAHAADGLFLWDPTSATLTDLGRGTMTSLGDAYVVLDLSTMQYSDVDPDRRTPRLRALASAVDHTPIGVLDGAIATFSRSANAVRCLGTNGLASEHAIKVPAGFVPVGTDAIRGHRLLLVDASPMPAFPSGPFTREVRILDLDAGATRTLGEAIGGHNGYTAVPRPTVRILWSDGERDVRDYPSTAAYNVVDVASERLDAHPARF